MSNSSVIDLTSPFEEAEKALSAEKNAQASQSAAQPEKLYVQTTLDPETAAAAQRMQAAGMEVKRRERKIRRIKVALPSQGKLYPSTSTLCGVQIVEIRNFTGPDEDILRNPKYARSGKGVDKLLEAVILTEGINPHEFLNGDREAVLLALRIDAFGADYKPEVKFTCEECELSYTPSFDLSKVGIKTPGKDVESGGDVFEIVVPSGALIGIRFLTNKDEEAIQEYIKHVKNTDVDHPRSVRRWFHAVHVNGNYDRGFIHDEIFDMDIRDCRVMDKFIVDNESNVIMKQEVECSQCLNVSEQTIPINQSFFYPKL